MDNGTTPPAKGRSRAGTKPRLGGPADPRTESVPAVDGPAPSNGNGNGNGHGSNAGNGNGHGDDGVTTSPGQRLKRRLAASALLRPTREPVIDAPDAESPDPAEAPSDAPGRGGPALLPPIRTDEPTPTTAGADESAAPTAGSAAGDAGSTTAPASPAPALLGRHTPAPPTVKPVYGPGSAPPGGVVAPSRVMPFIRPPATPDVAPGELVAQKVVAPVVTVPLDVPLDGPAGPDATGQFSLAKAGRPSITFQRRRTRPRVRRVTRVVRHIDTWSVFKVALVFSAFLYAVMLTAGVLLWHVAIATGTIDNVERFFEGFGWQTFKFKGGEIYHNAWIAGMFVAIGLTGFAVLIATMFNLITDLVGGIRVSVLEEEVLARRDRTAKVVVEDDPDAALPYDQARNG